MKKYLFIVLLIWVWNCGKEEEPKPDDCAGVSGGDNICAGTDEEAIN